MTRIRAWPYLWHEYITSTDHKRIGIMYIVLALVMLVRGFADAIMMRAQQSLAIGASQGYLPPEHYDQIFSAHGTIMIFFVAMPFVIGFMNFVVPLQLGVRDVAFPTMNNVSFWLTASGALLVNLSLFLGEFARTGWLGFPPLSEKAFSPGVGVDYYLVALQISASGPCSRRQFRHDDPQDARARHELHANAHLLLDVAGLNLLILAAFPVLTVTLALLMLDRYLGFHFFTNDGGGNSMLYMNLIWIWGIRRSTFWSCRRSASTRRSCRPSPESRCSATARWSSRRSRSASFRSPSGSITSSPWARAPTSMPSSASPA